jgi:hypothetical protein
MSSIDPATASGASALGRQQPVLRDRAGRVYEPAVGPRLKVLLAVIFAGAAVLGATGVYMLAIDVFEKARSITYTNQFTLWMILVHVLVGTLLVVPFLIFGFVHLASARHRKNRIAVRLGISLFITCILVGLTGLALIQIDEKIALSWLVLARPLPCPGYRRGQRLG